MARVPYVSRDDLPPDQQQAYDRVAATRSSTEFGAPRSFRALMNSPDAAEAIGALGDYLIRRSSLDPVARELAIMTVGHELDNPYVWAHHEPLAQRVGVSDNVLAAIKSGGAPGGLPAREGVFAQAAQEMVAHGTMTEGTFQAVLDDVGPQQTVDLIVAIGFYSMLSGAIKALGVELEPGYQDQQGP